MSAAQETLSPTLLENLAGAMASTLDLEEILRLARRAASWNGIFSRQESVRKRWRLGIARDEAFHFYYPDNLDALQNAGCELVEFSPMRDANLPAGLDGLYLGGGYPEEHAAALADNTGMLEQIRRFPGLVYAECGGLMYLSEEIRTQDGLRCPQVGRLPACVRMGKSRRALGYVEVTLEAPACWGGRGDTLRGHEYHYSELVRTPGWETVYAVRQKSAGKTSREGFRHGRVLASYIHLHFASRPAAVRSFVKSLGAI
jgi:cobyrinic acid a,c-diamide synthase